jgi:hypothetical protein
LLEAEGQSERALETLKQALRIQSEIGRPVI